MPSAATHTRAGRGGRPQRRGRRVVRHAIVCALIAAAVPGRAAEVGPLPAVRDPPSDRVALLPPVEFNLEQDGFATAPAAEPVPGEGAGAGPPRRRFETPYGSAAPVALGGFWAPATDVVRQPASLAMNAQFARVAAPLVPPAEGRPLWIGVGRFGRLELVTDAVLPDSGQAVPDQLWLVETGVTHVRPQDDGSTLGGTFLFGSASDRPYAAGRDLTLMAVAFYQRPAANDRDEWSFSAFYSPTSQLPYPLPGVAYVWRPDETLEARIGLPPAVEWRPTDDWTLSVNWFPLVNLNATARRRLGESLSLVAFYRTDTQIYFLADRLRNDERFFVFDQRAACGLERALGRGFTIELLASWLFDRELFQGTSFTSGRTDVIELEAGPALSLQATWRR